MSLWFGYEWEIAASVQGDGSAVAMADVWDAPS